MQTLPKFQEEYSAKLPALTLLACPGWLCMPPQQLLVGKRRVAV